MSEQETAIEKEQYSIHGLLKELGEYYEEDRGVVLNTVYPKLLRKQVRISFRGGNCIWIFKRTCGMHLKYFIIPG